MDTSQSAQSTHSYEYVSLTRQLLNDYDSFMYLKIFVDTEDEELINKYREAVYNHNIKLLKNIDYIDAGFDIYSPASLEFQYGKVNKLDFNIICSAQHYYLKYEILRNYNCGYIMVPRSSISKSNLRLANSIGIIDAGYRGHLIGMFDIVNCEPNSSVSINKFDRYMQICNPALKPIYVELVNSREDLGDETERGAGGFGSTGK